MLVLARKKGQSIIIGKDIKIFVVDVAGETVRLGIEAPPVLEIFRSEIYQALREENSGSVTSTGEALLLLKRNYGKGK
ncbi:MAG: carbon storage regulator CsrA [Firmicutes bacterium]|nr:carbon storage regulator CsrA [Bacillota bacterium]